ncbi:hypothetical protein GGR52DRAFT_172097 [Hypoxylon sp. FL1284]|nr:hypothetical protein GGR52DRAFT_172097 [Hypoxylon sp. FL1284]
MCSAGLEAARETVRALSPTFLRRACRVSTAYLSYRRGSNGRNNIQTTPECLTWLQDIIAIYESGDQARIQDLNSARRKAGKEVISKLLATINCDALRARAETLHNGVKCTVNLPPPDQAYFNSEVHGGRNYHGSIVFADGKTWLARFRLPNHNEPPLQERNFDRRSEFATYRLLAETAIPVPKVYDCADDEDPMNLVGAGYILLEKLAGKPLEWYQVSEVQKVKFSR